MGYAFHTSAVGVVFAPGIWEVNPGFSYTVTLWDSAIQTILAKKNVTKSATGFSYIGLSASETVALQPNHRYVIGFNSTPVGVPPYTSSPGREFYVLSNISDFNPHEPPFVSTTPSTEGPITIETAFVNKYGFGPPPTDLFPPNFGLNAGAMIRAVDFGFIY